jgi:hypothetical protein
MIVITSDDLNDVNEMNDMIVDSADKLDKVDGVGIVKEMCGREYNYTKKVDEMDVMENSLNTTQRRQNPGKGAIYSCKQISRTQMKQLKRFMNLNCTLYTCF